MENKQFNKSIISMFKKDQRVRKNEETKTTIRLLDKSHNLKIKQIIKKSGYPIKKQLGTSGMRYFWALIQHQDLDVELQKRCLKYCDFDQIEKAYLTDRILLNQGKKQIYGTQLQKNKTGRWTLRPIKNKKTLSRLRKSVGLEPLPHYIKRITQTIIK